MKGEQTVTGQLKPRRPPRRLIRSRAIRKPPHPRTPTSSSDRLPYTLKHIVELKLRGWSEREVGAYYGVSGPAIHAKLKGLWRVLDGESLEAYRDNKVAFLTAFESEMLKLLLDREKQSKATLGNVAYAFTQLHQAGRLESSQSTSNIALHTVVEDLCRQRLVRQGSSVDEAPTRESPGREERAGQQAAAPAGVLGDGSEGQEEAGS